MQRGVRVDQVRDAVRLLRDQGIETGMFLMWGYEGEDLSDIEATVEHVKSCRPDVFLTTVSYPIKGTPYYEDVADRLVRIGEWPTSTDREVRIGGRHSRRFYQFADQLLKSEAAGLVDEAAAARRGLRETLRRGGGVMLASRQRFAEDYLRIRRAEGRGSDDPEYYFALPFRDLSGAFDAQWAMRGRTYRYFEQRILPPMECGRVRWILLDVGAGCGWLSYRLALRGHRPVAVDLLADESRGIGRRAALSDARRTSPGSTPNSISFRSPNAHVRCRDLQCVACIIRRIIAETLCRSGALPAAGRAHRDSRFARVSVARARRNDAARAACASSSREVRDRIRSRRQHRISGRRHDR